MVKNTYVHKVKTIKGRKVISQHTKSITKRMWFPTPRQKEWGYLRELDGSSLDVCCEYTRSREAYAMAKPTHIDINTKKSNGLPGWFNDRLYILLGRYEIGEQPEMFIYRKSSEKEKNNLIQKGEETECYRVITRLYWDIYSKHKWNTINMKCIFINM